MGDRALHLQDDRRLTLTLAPFGFVAGEDLNHLLSPLSRKRMSVIIATARPLPSESFGSRRRQYRADDFLMAAQMIAGDRVLAVTNCDLYAAKLNFVFGMAESSGRCAMISLFRLHVGVDTEEFHRRAVKEAVHELGHTFGLSHCSNSCCVMHFSNCLGDTDRKGAGWCVACELQLRSHREQSLPL
jgi:archaemetzincin